MRILQLLTVFVLALSGCDRPASTEKTAVTPNNTGVNARDRDAHTKTPIDQNENQPDIDVTANIRKQVMDAKLSVDAQNVKIMTQDGQVTLRGPVKSAEEKKRIEAIARSVAGDNKVDSQLEIEQ